MARKKIGIGLSGGVDSACSAYLLQRQGYEVLGYTMLLREEQRQEAERAVLLAERLGIPHRILDFRRDFEERILSVFVENYAAGRTPSPCVRCNHEVKFGLLWQAMASDGCEEMSTGHYARLENCRGAAALYRARDLRKDQSYFLGWLLPEQLRHVRFPLQDAEKNEVKRMMADLFPPQQRESQDLCFLPDGDFASFVAARRPALLSSGEIVSGDGRRLGEHGGAFAYTTGQRRGLGLGGGPWYVQRTDLARNQVIVCRELPRCRSIDLTELHWQEPVPLQAGEERRVQVQLRFRMKPVEAVLICGESGGAQVVFPEDSAPPLIPCGQFCCCYEGDRVLGGGWISSVESW